MKLFYSLFFLILNFTLFSQDFEKPRIFVKKIQEPIKIDGILDEKIWSQADSAGQFWQFFPSDSVYAKSPTYLKVLYDDTHLYFGIKAQGRKSEFIVSSLRRDFSARQNDNVSVIFDTFRDGNNAFMFGVNAFNVQRESFVTNGGRVRGSYISSWDMKWQNKGAIHGDYFITEIAIPFTSIKFKEGSKIWNFQAHRWDNSSQEQSVWSRVPQNQQMSTLAYFGEMEFEEPLTGNKAPIYIIPYVNGLIGKNYESGEQDLSFSAGFDAKVAVTNGLNLDITYNPDFSNVEVDNIVTNLTRFEVSLPEKRQFFIDNNDLFGNFGDYFQRGPSPFFSRRIGIIKDSSGLTVQNKILGGVRLSGKLDENWRVGVLNMQTAADESRGIPSNNNSMYVLQRKVATNSNFGVFMVNRQTYGNYEFLNPEDRYSRVLGFDYNLVSSDNVWNGKFYLHKSFQPGDQEGNLASQALVNYQSRKTEFLVDLTFVDNDYRSDLGFVNRKDYYKTGTSFAKNFYLKSSFFNTFSPRLINLMFFKPTLDNKKVDHIVWLMNRLEFKNQANFSLSYRNNYTYLFSDFDPSRKEGAIPLAEGTDYTFGQYEVEFQSNYLKDLSYTVNINTGGFYNGTITSLTTETNYRIMPKALLSLNFNYNKINLPAPYSSSEIILINPKVDWTFTKNLFWSTLIQYSNLYKVLGINSRLQWRYAPLSDIYLVYNDNFNTEESLSVYRSLNLKASFWF